MSSKNKQNLFLLILFISSFFFNILTIDFGLPQSARNGEQKTIFWFNDEDKEVEHIKSLLEPRTEMLHFNYPPFQYILVSLIHAPSRIISGQLPGDASVCLTSRFLSALAVALATLLMYLIGEKLLPRCGLFSSLLFAVTPLAVMLAREMKPIALGGTLLLGAVLLALRLAESGLSRKGFMVIGALLGLSLMCSHLTAAYLHIPFVLIVFGLFVFPRRDPAEIHIERTAARSKVFYGLLCILFILNLLSIYCATYYKDSIFNLGKIIYSMQTHAKPFEQHIALINIYYSQFVKGLYLTLFVIMAFALYVFVTNRFSRYRLVADFPLAMSACGGVAAAVLVVLGTASFLNPLIPVSVFKFVTSASGYALGKSGYYGMYPGAMQAPSYVTEILPYCLGTPLYLCAAAGLLCLFSKEVRPPKFLLLLIFLPFAIQLLTWNSTFRASRFTYSTIFFLVWMAGLLCAFLFTRENSRTLRCAGIVLFSLVFSYTLLYSIAYTESRNYAGDGRVKTAHWIMDHIPGSQTVGLKAEADLPRNKASMEDLPGRTFKLFEEQPDYCVVDGFEYFVMRQCFDLAAKGYNYSAKDWWPSELPPQDTASGVYGRILNTDFYRMREHIQSDELGFWKFKFDLRLLLDPAEQYHREQYIFEKIARDS